MARKKKKENRELARIMLAEIDEPVFKVRGDIDEEGITELSQSIKSVGLIEPILVVRKKDRYEIIAGHRRFLAMRLLSWESTEALIFAGTKDQMTAVKLQENLHRQNLSVVEESRAIGYMAHSLKMDGVKIAGLMNKSEGYISQRLAVLQYPPGLLEALSLGQISFAVARQLYYIEDPNTLKTLVDVAIAGGCSEKTASMWRQQYETVTMGAEETAGQPADYQRTSPEQLTQFVCGGCKSMFNFPELSALYFCVDCKKSFN